MGKYGTLFRINWQTTLQYRWSVVIYLVGYSLYVAVLLHLWTAIYHQGDGVAGYTLSEILTYYLLQLVLNSVVFSYVSWDLIQHVREGEISNFLVRPLDPYRYYLVLDLSGRVLESLFVLGAVGLLVILVAGTFQLPPDGKTFMVFLVTVVLAILLSFELDFAIGVAAFWFVQVKAFRQILQSLILFFSGSLLPLDLFPAWLASLAQWLPFPYLVYFPVSVFLGRVEDPWPGLIRMGVWILVFYGFSRWLLGRGLRRYEAVGG